MKIQAICTHCKQEYTKTFKIQKYCCLECSRLASIKYIPTEHTCETCGVVFTAIKTRRFCGKHCASVAPKKQGVVKTGFIKSCLRCGKEFYATPSMPKKYCSQKCGAMSRGITVILKTCPICGQQYEAKRTDPNSITCGVKCGNIYKTKPKSSIYVIPKSSMKQCSVCGYNKYPALLERHHIDRDRSNNDITNLSILCPTCHDEIHYESKTGRFRFVTECKEEIAT